MTTEEAHMMLDYLTDLKKLQEGTNKRLTAIYLALGAIFGALIAIHGAITS